MRPTEAMVLAAGRGTRLGDLGERQAKTLIEIGGEPLLARQLRYLREHGIERVIINGSHLVEQLQEFASEHRGKPDLQLVVESEPLGTAGGTVNALPLFEGDPILVLYGDVLLTEGIDPLIALHAKHRPVATLGVFHSDDASAKGVVELSDSRVTGFHEKDRAKTSGWVNAGVYVIEPSWLAEWSDRKPPLDFGFDLFPAALAVGGEIRAHRLARPVLDIGTPADLARARELGSALQG
jgi:NDP-sugar pyrophosphorylase family protein